MISSVIVPVIEGYRLWSAGYDEGPNPLLALEMRVLSQRLGTLHGVRVLDAGSGTGRWMIEAASRGAHVFGIDTCREMALMAGQKPGLRGRTALADIRCIPLPDHAFDLSLSSFTIGYLPLPGAAFEEMARVSRRVIVSDLHPQAARSGWTRSFRVGNRNYEFVHYEHSIEELDGYARSAGLVPEWRIEVAFGEPEREIFRLAGKEDAFDKARGIPAVLINSWRRQSN
jgi:malonyl-CoA O-methyltransferase